MDRQWNLFAAAVALLTAASAWSFAQIVSQCELSYVTASDASPTAALGGSVAIVGDLMVSGARMDDGEATRAGAAYVYERVGGVWTESQKLVAPDAAADAYFGTSVATDGVRIVVGASGVADAGPDSGKAYVYRYDGAAWVEEAQLTAGVYAAAGDEFGWSVAIDQDHILVGAYLDDTDGVDTGSIYAFEYDGANWVDAGRVSASDAAAGDEFGSTLAIDGTRAVVGAIGDDEAEADVGAAYVIEWTGSAWEETAKLLAPDGAYFDSLGHSVAIEGSLVLASTENANLSDGAAYVFEHDGANWHLVQTLRHQVGLHERFGSAVAIDSGVIIVGEELGDGHYGASWVYKRIAGTYQPTEILRTSIRFGHDYGGRAVDISGDTVASGTEGQDIAGSDSGAVWFFETTSHDCDGDGLTDRCEDNLDCNDNGVFDRCEPDCNHNGIPDTCDIAAGTLADCSGNGVPDMCEPDCNGNGMPDDCDVLNGVDTDCNANGVPDACDLGAGAVVDCNDNGVLDACDVVDGTSPDANGDCIPDECGAGGGPVAEINGHPENRFLSFSPATVGCREGALRVELVSLTPPLRDFSAFDGQWRWVGQPVLKTEPTNDGPRYNWMAQLECEPHIQNWGGIGLLHVYDAEVMPQSTYAVSFYDASCGDVNNASCYSSALIIHTAKWADLAPPYDGETTAVEPDIRDVAALVDKFLGASWPTRAEADLEPNIPNVDAPIDFRDIGTAVDAYLGQPYPFAGPVACP